VTAPLPWDVPGRLRGADVSSVQPPRLPLDAFATAGFRWVDIKATEATWDDPRFAIHHADVAASGLATGAYHFFHSSEPWQAQADAFLRAIDGRDLTLRPTLDFEDQKRIGPNPRVALADALAWLAFVWHQTGRRPTVYTGKGVMDLLHGLDLSELLQYDLWVASYRWDPATGHDYGLTTPLMPAPWTEARAWQVGGNGAPRVPGVPYDVDLDVFFGDDAAFVAWCEDRPATTQPAPAPGPVAMPDGSSAHGLATDHSREVEDAAATADDLADTRPDGAAHRSQSSQRMAAVKAPDSSDDTWPGKDRAP
jgi:lysozyme